MILAGWINHQQQQAIDYLLTENQVFKEKFGNERILLNGDQRRRLAMNGKTLGRKLLSKLLSAESGQVSARRTTAETASTEVFDPSGC